VSQDECPYCGVPILHRNAWLQDHLLRQVIFNDALSQLQDGAGWRIDTIQGGGHFCAIHTSMAALGHPINVDFASLPNRIEAMAPYLQQLISSPQSYPLFREIELAYSGGAMPKDVDAIAGRLTQQSQLQIYFSPTG
jgi:hypothetical protein